MGTSVLFVVVTYPLMLRQTALEEIQKWSLILEHCAVSSWLFHLQRNDNEKSWTLETMSVLSKDVKQIEHELACDNVEITNKESV